MIHSFRGYINKDNPPEVGNLSYTYSTDNLNEQQWNYWVELIHTNQIKIKHFPHMIQTNGRIEFSIQKKGWRVFKRRGWVIQFLWFWYIRRFFIFSMILLKTYFPFRKVIVSFCTNFISVSTVMKNLNFTPSYLNFILKRKCYKQYLNFWVM